MAKKKKEKNWRYTTNRSKINLQSRRKNDKRLKDTWSSAQLNLKNYSIIYTNSNEKKDWFFCIPEVFEDPTPHLDIVDLLKEVRIRLIN